MRDLVPAAPQQVRSEPVGFDTGATRIFSHRPAAVPLVDAPQGGSRRVPQWIFLSHLFGDLILGDRAALGLTQKNVKVGFWRRALAASAALIALFLAGVWTFSYFNNQDLVKNAEDAAKATPAQQLSAAQLPSLDDLQRLEGVRQRFWRRSTTTSATALPLATSLGLIYWLGSPRTAAADLLQPVPKVIARADTGNLDCGSSNPPRVARYFGLPFGLQRLESVSHHNPKP